MAYDTENLKEKATEAIEEHKLFFIEDIVAYLPCSKPTFYEHFPKDSNELNELKELLYENKVKIKSSMRSKWYKSDNPTLQMGLMKLLANDQERKNLAMKHIDHTTGGEKITGIQFVPIDESGD